jgi:hypothetical protein
MAQKPAAKPKPKLTDAERRKRFVEMAREVGASESPRDFDREFRKVAIPKPGKATPKTPT